MISIQSCTSCNVSLELSVDGYSNVYCLAWIIFCEHSWCSCDQTSQGSRRGKNSCTQPITLQRIRKYTTKLNFLWLLIKIIIYKHLNGSVNGVLQTMAAVSRHVCSQELWVYGFIGTGVSGEDVFIILFMYALLADHSVSVCGGNPEVSWSVTIQIKSFPQYSYLYVVLFVCFI